MTTTSAIARAVATYLSGYGVVIPGTYVPVTFSWMPEFQLEDMDSLVISVVPIACRRVNSSRTNTQREHVINIGVMQRPDSNEDREDVYDDTDRIANIIADATERMVVPGLPSVHWSNTDQTSIGMPEHLREMNQLSAVITVTFKEIV